jgi:signal peptidase I
MAYSSPSDGSSGATYHRGRKRTQAALAAVLSTVAIVWFVLRWRPFRVEVTGGSMSPTLESGDWALAIGTSAVRRGDIVIVEHPARAGFEIVKRITAVPGDLVGDGSVLGPDRYWVQGDDPMGSTDSRGFGPIGRDRVRARVLLVYWPPTRLRVLGRSRA